MSTRDQRPSPVSAAQAWSRPGRGSATKIEAATMSATRIRVLTVVALNGFAVLADPSWLHVVVGFGVSVVAVAGAPLVRRIPTR